MKRKWMVMVVSLTLIFVLVECSAEKEVILVNLESSSDNDSRILPNQNIGISAMAELGDGVWYDTTTGIVYWWNGFYNASYASNTPSPYYSSNGYLYRYIPETNRLEEVKTDIQ